MQIRLVDQTTGATTMVDFVAKSAKTVGTAAVATAAVTANNSTNSNNMASAVSPTVSFSEILDNAVKAGSQTVTNVTTYGDIFKEAANKYGVDMNLLLAMGKQESNFDTNCTSGSGAKGVMQLMPTTASNLGVTDPYDAYQNIMGGAKLISELLGKYGGNTSMALAAYHAGSGAVDRAGGIPSKSQGYVNKVLGYMSSGVSTPTTVYSSSTTTAAGPDVDNIRKLENVLQEFSRNDPDDFEKFQAKVNEVLAQNGGIDDASDAYTQYQVLLGATNTAVLSMLQNI